MTQDFAQRLLTAEPSARRLVLAEALETSEAGRRLVGDAERERIDQEALAATGDPAHGRPVDAAGWLQVRADRIVGLAVQRQPRLDALASPGQSLSRWGWILPLLGFVVAILLERIDNPRQVNLLSPPLLAFLLWNLLVYVAIAAAAVLPWRPASGAAGHPLWRAVVRAWPARAGGSLRAQVAVGFGQRWLAVAGRLESLRITLVLHAAAAAWAAGVACSVLLGGVVHEYRIGWESTLLDTSHVHAVLRALYAPVLWAFQLEPFSLEQVRQLHFGAGPGDQMHARRWVWMYVALLALVVLVPRLLLAAWAGWRARRLARALVIDLGSAHYQQVLSRVSPASLRIGLLMPDAGARPTVVLLWRQAAGEGGWSPAEQPTDLLLTERGDRLQLQEVRPPLPVLDLLLVAGDEAALASCWPAVLSAGRPVLVLCTDGADACAARLRASGLPHQVLPLAQLPTWREDARLRAAVARLVPPHRRAGVDRLHAQWRQRAAGRLREAMGWLASDLLQAAADTERLPAWSLRGMLGNMDASEVGRLQAQGAIAQRLQVRQSATNARLLQRHALEAAPDGLLEHAAPAGFRSTGANVRQAGLAGAASGAALGATVDVATGLMSLGAASAMGGLIGGAAALGAVLWRRRQAGAPELAFDDGALEVLAQAVLLRYLAVVHAGRAATAVDQQRWAARVQAEVDRERLRLITAWAPTAPEGEEARHAALAQLLQDMVLAVLADLHGSIPEA